METAPSNLPERDNNESCGSCSNTNYPQLIPAPPLTPSSKPRSNGATNNPYPSTFVQADAATFKQVVQMLTGSSDAARPSARSVGIPPLKSAGQKKQGFKLYERRSSLKNRLMIDTLGPGLPRCPNLSPRKPELLSPSILDFPALALSPVTPANEDAPGRSSAAAPSPEDRAISEKKFYFHPSPRSAPGDSEPQLLPLFPVTSPRTSGSS